MFVNNGDITANHCYSYTLVRHLFGSEWLLRRYGLVLNHNNPQLAWCGCLWFIRFWTHRRNPDGQRFRCIYRLRRRTERNRDWRTCRYQQCRATVDLNALVSRFCCSVVKRRVFAGICNFHGSKRCGMRKADAPPLTVRVNRPSDTVVQRKSRWNSSLKFLSYQDVSRSSIAADYYKLSIKCRHVDSYILPSRLGTRSFRPDFCIVGHSVAY